MLKILEWKKPTYPLDMWVSKFLSHENIFRLTRFGPGPSKKQCRGVEDNF